MNENRSLEHQLTAVGETLRSRPSIADRVMVQVREQAAELEDSKPAARVWRRRVTAAALSLAGMAVTVAAILFALAPSPSVGWAQVVEALQTQSWIRGKVTFAGGSEGTMWLSPNRQIWAYKLSSTKQFFDGRERVKYEQRGRTGPILKLPLGEEDSKRVLSVEALSKDESAIGPWMFGEKIIQQERHEVVENGKKWIEFKLTLWRGEANQATLRVDPETCLPVYLLSVSPTGDVPPRKWEFDYPDDGPHSIYDLGVPRDTVIDDQVPEDDVVAALDTIAASRNLLGNFRLTVGDKADYRSFVVLRKGNRWRVDVYHGPYSLMREGKEKMDDLSVNEWLDARLEQSEPRPLYVCDGTTVLRNENSSRTDIPEWAPYRHIAPQDLLTCSASFDGGLSRAPYVCLTKMVYPDLTPVNWLDFEFVHQPADAPGCVLIKRSAYTTMGNHAHEWFYLDPTKDYAVVRIELFNVPIGDPADPETTTKRNRNTYRMEQFLRSPQGFWYPTIVHIDIQYQKQTVRYRYDFDVDLPDSLFIVPDGESGANEDSR